MTSPQGEFNFRFKLASPKFIVYCTRNCPITKLSFYVFRFFINNFSTWVFLSKKDFSSKMESYKRYILLYWSTRLFGPLFLTVDDKFIYRTFLLFLIFLTSWFLTPLARQVWEIFKVSHPQPALTLYSALNMT